MPEISVITPIYNTEVYLEKCLASLVAQTLEDIEFIWIDNGSNQVCKSIISKYARQRPNIKVISLEKNVGYGGAMNIGLREAKGKYIGFCDSDDWIDSEFYEKLYNATNNQTIDIVYAEYKQEFLDHTNLISHRKGKAYVDKLSEKLDAIRDGAIWDKIFKRELIIQNHIQFPAPSKSYFEDNIFLFQSIYFAKDLKKIKDIYYHYLQHESSTIHSDAAKKERDTYKSNVIAYIINFATKYNFSLEEKIECLKFLNRSLGLSVILRTKEGLRLLQNKLDKESPFDSFLYQIYGAHNPSLREKFFSIQNDFKQNFLWILGIKIRLKNKEKI